GVLVQPSFFGTDNREMLDALARQPAKLRGVAVVTPSIDAGEIARLHALGVRAVRLNLHGVNDFSPYRAAAWTRLLDRIAARGWPFPNHESEGGYAWLRAALGGWLDERSAARVLWDNAARLYDLS